MPIDATLPYDDGNIFARILRGEIPSKRVYEDEFAIAFHDINPQAPIHLLVIPRDHYETLPDLPAELVGPLFTRVQRVSAALPAALGAQGSFVALNNVVSQSVPHLHVHVVPRTRGDGLRGFFWPRQRYADEAEAAAYAQRIRDALAAGG